ncbi:2-succinyl-6-hydroxy-2,4-cyclohexadiene-1-carboxylate synthase [Vespertiliibacter pulmonis]|uniref:Putative 2-succinyl-6-hydroxy-2,4-cyclohexadiene-1-carboxylate synthase n=1 Tax=Vespertiliibacter pulmonis TaxID=1443036 RepID=A0A3N4VL57_9PAST|nr:2-succinyl-6-hydroxy-2,4-cyclohexadiene-1-carboxylate synthase [Vespertiliibacter pulmonis]QLB20950.1 2-succinyl-6-hydroxy-2,4-cyclohexadiene-1-carboxylate synthase [Vespertiliibacter pulmonis]RPE83608.1 2-succinyl-6-hydroxy-2,4-cyclohexadiene-1-carboxylate synthase [Vespertiliibacter pulmonis]
MLAYQWYKKRGKPVVFLHGLLGSKQDWEKCFDYLQIIPEIRPLTLDLPFHGESQNIPCTNFAEMRQLLHSTLNNLLGNEPFWLVGYSLGGRLALDYTLNNRNPKQLGTVLEGTNIGLNSEQERANRWQNDCHWAERFRTEPIRNVLTDWYQQPVFRQLSTNKRLDLINNRQKNNGLQIAHMLKATSLAKQENFSGSTWENIYFLIGEQDNKFQQIAYQNNLPYRLISHAGHNTHWENPKEFMQQLRIIMEEKNNGTTSLS